MISKFLKNIFPKQKNYGYTPDVNLDVNNPPKRPLGHSGWIDVKKEDRKVIVNIFI